MGRKGEVVSLSTLDTRVSALEEGFHDMRRAQRDAANEMRANTRLTEEIHGEVDAMRRDTEGVVAFVKRATESWDRWTERASNFRRFSSATAKYITVIATAIGAVAGSAKLTGLW